MFYPPREYLTSHLSLKQNKSDTDAKSGRQIKHKIAKAAISAAAPYAIAAGGTALVAALPPSAAVVGPMVPILTLAVRAENKGSPGGKGGKGKDALVGLTPGGTVVMAAVTIVEGESVQKEVKKMWKKGGKKEKGKRKDVDDLPTCSETTPVLFDEGNILKMNEIAHAVDTDIPRLTPAEVTPVTSADPLIPEKLETKRSFGISRHSTSKKEEKEMKRGKV